MKRIFGLAAIVAGAVLAIFFPDLKFGWFEGRPFGVILVILGGIELLESMRRRKPKGLVEELRDDFGLGSSRNRGRGDVQESDRGRDRDPERDRELERKFDREAEREARKYRDYPDL